MEGSLTIEHQLEQALAAEFGDVAALRDVAFIASQDTETRPKDRTVRVVCDVALPGGEDAFSGSLFEADVLLTISTVAPKDDDGTDCRDLIALIRDTIYVSGFTTNVTARLTAMRLDAMQFAGGRPDTEGDAVTEYEITLRAKVQKV